MNKDAVAEMSQPYQVETAEKRVPEGYKQTELGVIPEDWEVRTYGEIFNFLTTSTNSRSDLSIHAEYGYIHYGDIHTLWNNFLDLNKTNTPKIDPLLVRSAFVQDGDLVMADASEDYEGIGKSIEIKNIGNKSIVAGLHTYLLRDSYSFFVDGFKGYLHQVPAVKSMIDKLATGMKVYGISKRNLEGVYLPIPSKKEQTAIANALSDTDALLSELEKLIAKKQAIKTATMQQLLTGRTRLPQFAHHSDGSKKAYKQSELGEMPEDWEVIQLGEITTFLKGAGLPKSDLIDSGKNRCIHYGQLFTSYGPKIEKIFSSTDIDGSIKSETNDVLMPTSDVTPNGLATASCILESGIVLGGDILIIRSKKELLDGVFFAYLITVMRDQIMQLVTGSTVYHLYGSDMARFFFARPSIDEQTAIATILADMDEEIQALEQRLNKTRQIKQGMMQELLTGKTRLLKGGKNV